MHESVYSVYSIRICKSDPVKTVADDFLNIWLVFILFKSLADSIKKEAIDYREAISSLWRFWSEWITTAANG